jgi:hypothetical protein
MAGNALYPLWKENVIQASASSALNGSGTTGVYAALITTSSGYAYSAAHQYYSDLTNIVGTDQEIGATKTYTSGTFKTTATNTYSALTGTVVGAVVLYIKNAGANTTWRLVCYLDTGITGLPVTPNGGDVTMTWNASGIFTVSDARFKEDVRQIGVIRRKGFRELPVYRFRYAGTPQIQVGLMAQDVERMVPKAVREIGGMKTVNYQMALAA